MERLLNYQVPHVLQLEESLLNNNCILDCSDTGTGKTYTTLALVKKRNLTPFIICPKSVIKSWLDVANEFNVKIFGICNYELLKNNKYYNENLEKIDFQYMEIVKVGDKETRVFLFPQDIIVIFDEAHRCKNHKSETSQLLLSIKKSNVKMVLLSATLTDKLECFKPFGVVFNFYNDVKEFKSWIRSQKIINKIKYNNSILTNDQISLDIIHNKLFPRFGSRMKIKELGNLFPSNQILCQSYLSENTEKINEQYNIIKQAFLELKNLELRSKAFGKIIRARMKIEMYKIPIMLDVIKDGLENNLSIAIFVNYKETLFSLCHYLDTDCVIFGDQSLEERNNNIDRFQSNQSNIIIAIIQAGGVGISLHDIHGNHQRMSVISPTWSGQDMQQVLGRIHRAGSQSTALQKIIYCANTYEESICKIIKTKLSVISQINDNDLSGLPMTDELFEETKFDNNNLFIKK